ncbi:hypothetical protein KIN20_007570 [Parelaphostrongylus tenuis]|uniref:Tudor domain-containing protein n=1 Tax=Parelaphostrongylus tenuis TaxID=148309 RepID=A0AAD5QHY8_PARTN|nr:hypothetical protein KIN20_007570 [Parelaphostrongylus tenuis]
MTLWLYRKIHSAILKTGDVLTTFTQPLMKRLPEILVRRFENCGYVLWDDLSFIEQRIVDYNPLFFNVSVVLPEMADIRVDLLTKENLNKMDTTCESGSLRPALDEDVTWLTDAEHVFSRYQEDVRMCAVMAFLPPRCFIFCDNTGCNRKQRLLDINEGLRISVLRKSLSKKSVEIRPGKLLVGLRMGLYMRVIVLENDVFRPMMIRCVCLDYNAIYSFGRHELFNLPEDFSVKAVPTNAFLGRYRGTFYVYQSKQEQVKNAMRRLESFDGTRPYFTCAVYGSAPDGLIIVDTCIMNLNEWRSESLITRGIAAPMDDDVEIKLSPDEARMMWKDKFEMCAKSMSVKSSGQKVQRTRGQNGYPEYSSNEYDSAIAERFAGEFRLLENSENPSSTNCNAPKKMQSSSNEYGNRGRSFEIGFDNRDTESRKKKKRKKKETFPRT